jgi:hypothetical protein
MAKQVAAALLVAVLVGCNGTKIPTLTPPSTSAATTERPADGIPVGGAKFDTYELSDLISDRVPAPNISTMRNNPVFALGTLYARVALPGKTCDDPDTSAWKFARLLSLRSEKCEVETKPSADQLVSKKVKGGGAATFKALIGDVTMDAEAAFEFFISEPVSAYFKDSMRCFDQESLKKYNLPPRTCEVFWISGVTLTQVSYRSYRQLKGTADAAFAVVKIDGNAYYNTDDTQTRYLMTVDPIEVSQEFQRKGAFLTKVLATRGLVEGSRLAPDQRARHVAKYFTPDEP